MEEYAYPGLLLMEHAALALFKAIKARFPLGKVGIICGKGNNAGDGWALARLLALAGAEVMIFCPHGSAEFAAGCGDQPGGGAALRD